MANIISVVLIIIGILALLSFASVTILSSIFSALGITAEQGLGIIVLGVGIYMFFFRSNKNSP